MPELLLTLESMHKTEKRKQKFMAALQGIDLDESEGNTQTSNTNSTNNTPLSVEDVKARAVARLTGDENMAGAIAEGFTSDKGLEYKIMGGTELG